jgi:hypothetical protein
MTKETTIASNIIYTTIIGMFCFIKLYLNLRNYMQKVILISELEEIKNDVLLDLKIRTYNYLFKSSHIKKSELLLASLLKIHYDKCEDTKNCPCKNRNSLFDPKKYEFGDD